MSENFIPEEIIEKSSDVANETVEQEAQIEESVVTSQVEADSADLSSKTLAELSELFQSLKESADKMMRSKEAESIKSAFYKLLGKMKSESQDVPAEGEELASHNNPFEAIEQNFKAIYADYKRERAEFNKQQEQQREENLAKKKAVIEELKALVEKGDDVSSQFPAFRALQDRWREAGPIPAGEVRDTNATYQFYVEKFYDMVKINREMRDLDFRKNLEAKEAFCEAAEKLSESESIVNAFHELQKLHEQWKEYGPVAKEKRDDIWNRFKAATSVINKRYQAYFDGLKSEQEANFAAKTALCEKVEAIADKENISSGEWNTLSKQIETLQEEWKTIGFATRKDNQKVYERFRAACDKFYARKREYYNSFKDSMNENLEKKLSLIEQAEALKTSTDWKKTTDQFIMLQKQWKEVGAVPRKKSEQLWKRFRTACDEFFAERDKHSKPENDYYSNLKAKKALIEEILSYELSGDAADSEALAAFNERWQAIGHVPYKEKDNINTAFRDAIQKKFPRGNYRQTAKSRSVAKSPKEQLIDKYRSLQQDIVTYENNIGFFSATKNSEALIKQMQKRIDEAKAELKTLEEKIRKSEEE